MGIMNFLKSLTGAAQREKMEQQEKAIRNFMSWGSCPSCKNLTTPRICLNCKSIFCINCDTGDSKDCPRCGGKSMFLLRSWQFAHFTEDHELWYKRTISDTDDDSGLKAALGTNISHVKRTTVLGWRAKHDLIDAHNRAMEHFSNMHKDAYALNYLANGLINDEAEIRNRIAGAREAWQEWKTAHGGLGWMEVRDNDVYVPFRMTELMLDELNKMRDLVREKMKQDAIKKVTG